MRHPKKLCGQGLSPQIKLGLMKLLLTLIMTFCGIYLAGDMVRQNPTLNALLSSAEKMYAVLNRKVANTSIIDGLRVLQRVYGVFTITLAIAFAITIALSYSDTALSAILAITCLTATFAWFSILWCLDHKRVVSAVVPNAALMVFGPIAIGVMDLLTGTNFTSILASPLLQLLQLTGLTWNVPSNPITIGAVSSVVFTAFWLAQYAIAWALCFPFAFLAALTAAAIMAVAKAIDRFAPKKPFVGAVVLVLITCSIALVYA